MVAGGPWRQHHPERCREQDICKPGTCEPPPPRRVRPSGNCCQLSCIPSQIRMRAMRPPSSTCVAAGAARSSQALPARCIVLPGVMRMMTSSGCPMACIQGRGRGGGGGHMACTCTLVTDRYRCVGRCRAAYAAAQSAFRACMARRSSQQAAATRADTCMQFEGT